MEYPAFKINQLQTYGGNNPFILNLENKYRRGLLKELTPFENEYLLKNLKFSPYDVETLVVKVGEKTAKKLKSDFSLDREVSEVKINQILGETDEFYHVSYYTGSRNMDFWLYKDEVGDLYEQNYIRLEINFEELNSKFTTSNLLKHQESAVQFLLFHQRCYLMDTVGAGKTHTSIAATIAGECKKVLIICIAGKQLDWKKELKLWGEDSKIIWGEKGWIEDSHKYTIIGCDVLHAYHEEGKKGKDKSTLFRPLIAENYDCVIIDEAQKFRKRDAKKSKILKDLTSHISVKYVWAMTATAIEKNEDMYNLCFNLNINVSDIIFTAYGYHYNEWYSKYDDYMRRYCGAVRRTLKTGKSILMTTGNTNSYELAQRLKHIQRRRRTETTTSNFPQKIVNQLFFELTLAQKKKASVLFDDYVAKKGNKKLEEVKDLTETILLRQFYAIQKAEHTVRSVMSNVEDGYNCLVFTNFVEEYEIFKKKFGKHAVCVDSGMDGTRRQKCIDDFMTDPKKKILVGNIKSIGTGLNITKADCVYFNSPSWSSDEHEQAEGRTWRLGRVGDVEVFYVMFDDSIEIDVYQCAWEKQKNRNIFYGEQIYNHEENNQ
jgi:SNF2 family DNA or RNA helicase